jgi:hypothetical protein
VFKSSRDEGVGVEEGNVTVSGAFYFLDKNNINMIIKTITKTIRIILIFLLPIFSNKLLNIKQIIQDNPF